MKTKLVTALFGFMLFASMQCNKTPPEPPTTQPDGLPIATQEGKNTFGCFWNDTLWLPVGGISGPAIRCTYDIDSNWLIIVVRNENLSETFSFFLKINSKGYYELTDIYPNKVEIYKGLYSYIVEEPNRLKINITNFIKPNRTTTPNTKGVASGTFTAKFYKQNSSGSGVDLSDSIIIKKAVFDLQVN